MAESPPALCPRLRSLLFNRFSPTFCILFLLAFLFLFQTDSLPESWRFPATRNLLPPPPPPHFQILPPPAPQPSPNESFLLDPLPAPPPDVQNPPTLAQQETPPLRPSSNGSRVAVCLVGGARAFELTGPSIIKYLLRANNNTDVFVHAPLDEDAHKLFLLKDVPNLVRVRIFTPKRIPENQIHRDVLTAVNSPNGVQGLLQYFRLVEGCIKMVRQHQSNHSFIYDWIVRTRLDGYWNARLPSLDKMDHRAYTVPLGSQFGGLNDRLGIGNWKTSKVALSRLSLLPTLHNHGMRGLNSESFFKQQLKVGHVKYKLKRFPFCILSHRRYGWPPGQYGVPVLSISSRGLLNGAKCRPCTPVATGADAKSILDAQVRSWGWTGTNNEVELCRPTGDWEMNWEDIFDSVAGPEFQAIRTEIQNQNLTKCIEDNKAFKKQVAFWDAASPTAICAKGLAL